MLQRYTNHGAGEVVSLETINIRLSSKDAGHFHMKHCTQIVEKEGTNPSEATVG